jgi:hypothetical protein
MASKTTKGEQVEKISLRLSHAFGSLTSKMQRNCVYFYEEDSSKLIYPVGRYLAYKSIDLSDTKDEITF